MRRVRISIEVVVLGVLIGLLGLTFFKGKSGTLNAARELEGMLALATGDGNVRIGEADVFDNLAVYPIFAAVQEETGPVISLQAALDKSVAEVRELGAEPAQPEAGSMGNPVRHRPGLMGNPSPEQRQFRSGATVNQLVIENKGNVPIYVLAGTIVKGGNQDRQIGQDFIVAAKSTVPVDAFCVEHGRWDSNREGSQTDGKFVVSRQLATAKVRIAGQYKSDQSEVWEEVGKVNAANGVSAPTDTLLATLDDEKVATHRAELAKRIAQKLDQRKPNELLVGIGYAVNGKVKGVRWFANHQLFTTFRDVLVNTAATDAVAVEKEAREPAPAAEAVSGFLKEVDEAKVEVEKRETMGENVNAYKKAKIGASSATRLKKPGAPGKALYSNDYVAY